LARGGRHRLRGVAIPLTVLLVALGLASCTGDDEGGGQGTELTWFIANQPGGSIQEVAARCSEESNGRYHVKVELLAATDANQAREQLVRRLGAEDDSIDIIGMDVIWTAEFANAGWIREWTGDDAAEVSEGVFDSVLESASFDGKLYGAPHSSNTQVLWYRSDLVPKPPKTWEEMLADSEELGPEGIIQVQANRYEGFTVWFNAMIESAGTHVLSEDGELDLEQGPTEEALSLMGQLGNSPTAAAPDIDTSDEGSAALGFEAGSSAFMLNYTFAFASATANAPDIAKTMKAAKLPEVVPGQPSAPPLGGFNLGISEFSQNPELAFEAAKCLVNDESELTTTELDGLPPTREYLYSDPVVQKAYPDFAGQVKRSIADAAPRPQTPAYTDLSLAIQRALHPVRSIDPDDPSAAYDKVRSALEDAIQREGLL
jgi:multiple sugar transport system substrate-binding protein